MRLLKVAILALFMSVGCAASAHVELADPSIKCGMLNEINEAQFRRLITDSVSNWVMKSSRPAVIDFNALWCGPCRKLTPVLVQLAKEYEGKVDFYSVNIDDNNALARELGISSIPCVFFCPIDGKPQIMVGVPVKRVEDLNDPDKIKNGMLPYLRPLLDDK